MASYELMLNQKADDFPHTGGDHVRSVGQEDGAAAFTTLSMAQSMQSIVCIFIAVVWKNAFVVNLLRNAKEAHKVKDSKE